MASDQHEWSVPAPLRALLWWPPVAFVVALLDPELAAGRIAVIGGVLAVLGVVGGTVGVIVARRLAASQPAPVTVIDAGVPGSVGLPGEQAA